MTKHMVVAPPDISALLDDIRRRRAEFHALGIIPRDIVDRFRQAGVYRAFVPARFGGSESSPADFLHLIERIAAADGSAGWVASFGFASKYLSSLPASTLAAIYADGPDVVFAGAVFPPQPAHRDGDGYRVSGRWSFGSGSACATLIGVGIRVEGEQGGLPRMAVMPSGRVRIEPNWDVMGMAATGSNDLVVDDVFVPEDYTLVRGAPPSIDTAAYRYPTMAMAAQVLTVVGLGVAREAIDEVVRLATRKQSITGAPSMADRAGFQIALAQMEAQLGAARAWFYEVTEAAWERVVAGDELPAEQVARLRIACTHAARVGADVARRAFELSGTTGIFNSHPLSRHVQDAMVVAQHAFVNDGTWQAGGGVLLGKAPPPGYP